MNDTSGNQTIDIDAIVGKIQQFTVETPSWGYGDSGTRFKVFHWPGAARTLWEKLADAAVDRAALREAQEAGDVLGAYRVLQRAYETDVRPLLAEIRVRQGRDPDPIATFRRSGYAEHVARERVALATSSGYPGA